MFYSKLYKSYYPFHSSSNVFSLNEKEKSLLIEYIKCYPRRLCDKLHSARKSGIVAEGLELPKGWKSALKSSILPSIGLPDIFIALMQKCNELIFKIENQQVLSDSDIDNINRILYSNKYGTLLSWFLCPSPDGEISAIMK